MKNKNLQQTTNFSLLLALVKFVSQDFCSKILLYEKKNNCKIIFQGSFIENKIVLVGDNIPGSRFGTAVANIGDLNQDGIDGKSLSFYQSNKQNFNGKFLYRNRKRNIRAINISSDVSKHLHLQYLSLLYAF